jgi:hypothetical protein
MERLPDTVIAWFDLQEPGKNIQAEIHGRSQFNRRGLTDSGQYHHSLLQRTHPKLQKKAVNKAGYNIAQFPSRNCLSEGPNVLPKNYRDGKKDPCLARG